MSLLLVVEPHPQPQKKPGPINAPIAVEVGNSGEQSRGRSDGHVAKARAAPGSLEN